MQLPRPVNAPVGAIAYSNIGYCCNLFVTDRIVVTAFTQTNSKIDTFRNKLIIHLRNIRYHVETSGWNYRLFNRYMMS